MYSGDIAMIDGDVIVTPIGDLGLVHDNNEIIQTANNNIAMRIGEVLSAPEYGNNIYNRRIKSTESGLSAIEHECSAAISLDTRISQVTSIDAVPSGNNRCELYYTIELYDGTILSNTTIVNLVR